MGASAHATSAWARTATTPTTIRREVCPIPATRLFYMATVLDNDGDALSRVAAALEDLAMNSTEVRGSFRHVMTRDGFDVMDVRVLTRYSFKGSVANNDLSRWCSEFGMFGHGVCGNASGGMGVGETPVPMAAPTAVPTLVPTVEPTRDDATPPEDAAGRCSFPAKDAGLVDCSTPLPLYQGATCQKRCLADQEPLGRFVCLGGAVYGSSTCAERGDISSVQQMVGLLEVVGVTFASLATEEQSAFFAATAVALASALPNYTHVVIEPAQSTTHGKVGDSWWFRESDARFNASVSRLVYVATILGGGGGVLSAVATALEDLAANGSEPRGSFRQVMTSAGLEVKNVQALSRYSFHANVANSELRRWCGEFGVLGEGACGAQEPDGETERGPNGDIDSGAHASVASDVGGTSGVTYLVILGICVGLVAFCYLFIARTNEEARQSLVKEGSDCQLHETRFGKAFSDV